MWADVDTNKDFLNYSEVADLVADVIRDPTMRPVTVGVFGSWGTGKSTLLNLIEGGLNPHDATSDFIIVRFDAWLYQGFDDSRAALMEVIASTLIEAAQGSESVLPKAKRLFSRVNKMRALGLLVEGSALAMGMPAFGFGAKGVEALSKVFSGDVDGDALGTLRSEGVTAKDHLTGILAEEKQQTPPKQIAAFRSEFSEVLTGLNKTLVVFVDNLDRCLPKQTIHTLEALRLFLFMNHTAFVVAADEEMVRHSVSEHFKDPGDRHITDYLDKLIQVPVRVPMLGVQEVRAYLFMLFASAGDKISPSNVENLRAGLEDNLRKAWKEEPVSTEKALGLLGDDLPIEVKEAFPIADRMAPMLANSASVLGNPRIVKRMLNVVRMRVRVAKLRGMPVNEALIAKVALFERCMDEKAVAYLYSVINSAAGGKPEILGTLEGLVEDAGEFEAACPDVWKTKENLLKDWVRLEPSLSTQDLRPIVYLSRETTPMRILRAGLSAEAAEALTVLKRITNTSSPSAKLALQAIPSNEHVAVMVQLIESMRSHSDWSVKAAGFDGAQLLADKSQDAGELLSDFIHTVMPDKLKPWMNPRVRDKRWFNSRERK
ncbi:MULTISPECIES: P-loop NTPase fold protein [unclassified Pseudomonas]|uniref:KAP family P-loop NTPase fold protein n=1 Tax=unclassified Pseudomonas TaxID=196821 RepID=UPI0015A29142|nr:MULTISPECIES: P-loop NTPase fold protein [unclassified Pseudomonas]NWA33170.1 NTPase KAP [Pseudomonas sp. C6002]NWB63448.1 NTPase KAP [Pseudomonas sp. F1002]